MRNKIVCVLFGVFSFIYCVSGWALQLKVDDQVVQPACMALFNQDIVSYPVITGVDIERCQRNEKIPHMTGQDKNGVYFHYDVSAKDKRKGYYAYKVLGQADDGIYVVHTFNQPPGASGLYDMILFLRMSSSTIPVYHNTAHALMVPTHQLLLEGYVVGGDRCSGGIKSTKLQNNHLTIYRYPVRNSVDQCEGEIRVEIELP